MEKQKVYTTILSDYWYLSKHCRLTMFSWASVPVLAFLDQKEKFATSVTCVTKFTIAAKATFICKILCLRDLKYFLVEIG